MRTSNLAKIVFVLMFNENLNSADPPLQCAYVIPLELFLV